jgi:transposase
MDKGYDSDTIRETIADKEMVAVIPPKVNRTQEIDFDKQLYKLRNKIERFINLCLRSCSTCQGIPPSHRTHKTANENRMKQFRRIATRYEKLAETYLVFLYIVAVYVLLS